MDPIPPLPPSPEMLRQSLAPLQPPAPPEPPGSMNEFLQRRLESLERDLALQRERAQAAQNLLQQKEALSSEVEASLKGVMEQLKREKSERESDEAKAQARGRIDALEKRLDEMHQAWTSLLKETIAKKDSGGADVSEKLVALAVQLAQWREENRGLSQALPELRQLAGKLADPEKAFEALVGQKVLQLGNEIGERLASWERRQALEAANLEERLESLARERAAMLQAVEEQNHAIRQQHVQENIRREEMTLARIGGLARKFEEAGKEGERLSEESRETKAQLAKILQLLTATPQAKDEITRALEREKKELSEALQLRSAALQQYTLERREIEQKMGEDILGLHRQIHEGEEKCRGLAARLAELELENGVLKDKTALAQKTAQEKVGWSDALAAEKEELTRALFAQAEKIRAQIAEQSRSDQEWGQKLSELQKKLAQETQGRVWAEAGISELRAQIATLTEHMTKALQDKDAVIQRFASWGEEREKLLTALKEKDEMVAMLNATFQNLLKKP